MYFIATDCVWLERGLNLQVIFLCIETDVDSIHLVYAMRTNRVFTKGPNNGVRLFFYVSPVLFA